MLKLKKLWTGFRRTHLMLYILFAWMLGLGGMTAGMFQQYSLTDFTAGLQVIQDASGTKEAPDPELLRKAFKPLEPQGTIKGEIKRKKGEKFTFTLNAGKFFHWVLFAILFIWMWPYYGHHFIKAEKNLEKIERRIVGLPVILFLLVWLSSIDHYFSSSWMYADLYEAPSAKIKSIFAASALLHGAFAGYLNLELTTLYVRRFIAQPFFEENNPYGLKPGLAVGLTTRHALMIFSLAMVPLALCVYIPAYFNWGLIDQLRTANDSSVFFAHAGVIVPFLMTGLITVFMLLFHLLSVLLFRWNVQLPLRSLIHRMRSVAKGDFEAKTKVLDSDEIGELKGHFNMMLDGLQEREKIKDTFGKYVSIEIAEKILKTGSIDLAGEEIEATILFSDIRNFTTLSEKMPPRELVAFINAYFGKITVPIVAERGVINKFIGDAVMAIFSPVFGVEDHAAAALRAAAGMKTALGEFNAADDYPPIAFGVGLHTGTLIAGNVGTADRLEYTVLGDTVNVASRIESQTKEQNTEVLVSGDLRTALGDSPPKGISLVGIGPILMKGKSKPMELFRVEIDS